MGVEDPGVVVDEAAIAEARTKLDVQSARAIDQQFTVLVALVNNRYTENLQVSQKEDEIERMIAGMYDERWREAYKRKLMAMRSAISYARSKHPQA